MKISIELNQNQVAAISMYLKEVCGIEIVDNNAIANELAGVFDGYITDVINYVGAVEDMPNVQNVISEGTKLINL